MYAKTIKYQTYDDEPETIVETFYFNLNQAEAMEMELGTQGGLEKLFNRIVIERNVPKMTEIFKNFILKSYGVRSDDGKRFRKSPELSAEFEQTDAYNVLMTELFTKEGAALEFLRNIMPKFKDANGKEIEVDMEKEMKKRVSEDPVLANALGIDEEEDK